MFGRELRLPAIDTPIQQVLLVTDMRRSESLLDSDLFQYHNHFEFLGLLGKTQSSEVTSAAALLRV